MGLRPPFIRMTHEFLGKSTNGGLKPIVGGPRGQGPLVCFTCEMSSVNRKSEAYKWLEIHGGIEGKYELQTILHGADVTHHHQVSQIRDEYMNVRDDFLHEDIIEVPAETTEL